MRPLKEGAADFVVKHGKRKISVCTKEALLKKRRVN
jgi:hypothetical protein